MCAKVEQTENKKLILHSSGVETITMTYVSDQV